MGIGLILKQIRSNEGATQKEVAEKLEISRSYYSDLENDRYFPSGKLLIRMNDEFEIFDLIKNDGKTIR